MSERFRSIGLVLLGLTLCPWVASASAASHGCAGSSGSNSALNQYCETIPSSTGAQPGAGGGHSLASTLPAATVRRITGAASGSNPAGTGASSAVGGGSGSRSRQAVSTGGRAGGVAPVGRRSAKVSAAAQTRAAERRRLLTLPAASRDPRRARLDAAVTSVWSLYALPVAILAAIALGLAGTAMVRSHHRRPLD